MKTISIAKEFSRFPGGRFRSDGPFSGEALREDVLRPMLAEEEHIVIELDDVMGYPASFLEEAFGGLARTTAAKTVDKLILLSDDQALIDEIKTYIEEAGS